MKIRFILFLFLEISGSTLHAQLSLSGRIVDSQTTQPIFGANIFASRTMIGVSTDSSGYFSINDIPGEHAIIVVSHVAYSSIAFKINQPHSNFIIELDPVLVELKQVDITAREDKKWKRQFSRFEKLFLGSTENASACIIKNPWVIDFDASKNGNLIASANELIEIENRATGYTLFFLLGHFEAKGDDVSYSGRQKFEQLNSTDSDTLRRWEVNRQKTFLGSKRHFFKSLVQDNLEQNGYHIYEVKLDDKTRVFLPVGAGLIYRAACFSDDKLQLDNYLKIVYVSEKADAAYFVKDLESTNKSSPNRQYQTSYLYSRKSSMPISENGVPASPEYLIEYGYWAWERIAELLPIEYSFE